MRAIVFLAKRDQPVVQRVGREDRSFAVVARSKAGLVGTQQAANAYCDSQRPTSPACHSTKSKSQRIQLDKSLRIRLVVCSPVLFKCHVLH